MEEKWTSKNLEILVRKLSRASDENSVVEARVEMIWERSIGKDGAEEGSVEVPMASLSHGGIRPGAPGMVGPASKRAIEQAMRTERKKQSPSGGIVTARGNSSCNSEVR